MGSCCAVLRGSSVDPTQHRQRGQQQQQQQQQQQGAFQGQGFRLGSGEAPADADERRAAQQRAAEARKAQWDSRAGVNNANARSTPTSSSTRAPQPPREPSRQGEQTASTAQGPGAAAERRAQQAGTMPGISSEKAEAMRQRQIKDDLLGRIEHFYKQAGEDVPFGLASCSVEQLRKHLDHAKSLAQGGASKAMVQN